MGNLTQQNSSEALQEMSNACAQMHGTPLLATSEKLGRTAAWNHVEQSTLLAPCGSVPKDWGVPTKLWQLQELAADTLTCSK